MTYKLKNERETLLAVRNALAEGEIAKEMFNMNFSCIRVECGTVACIGGWAWLIENPGDYVYARQFVNSSVEHDTPLYNLFYPGMGEDTKHYYISASAISIDDAVRAIDNYLDGYEDPWKGIIVRDLV